ncbi:MAG: hypothetical protein PHU85_13035 [Phycisphaerae bacterium]|nr:hypothetical protein [Phycisphaerae bacterium]
MREVMEGTVPEIRFNAVSFEVALKFLSDLQRVGINPNWAAMEKVGITGETPISLQLRDVTYETALRETLTKAAGKEGVIDYIVRGGKIQISTTEELEKLEYVLAYDVRDLLMSPLKDDEAEARRRLRLAVRQSPPLTPELQKRRIEVFLTLLRSTVEPASWQPSGHADIIESGGFLAVRQTPHGHRALAEVLGRLFTHSRLQIGLEIESLVADEKAVQTAVTQARLPATQPDLASGLLGPADEPLSNEFLRLVSPHRGCWHTPNSPIFFRTVERHGRDLPMAFIPPMDPETGRVTVIVPAPARLPAGALPLTVRMTASEDRKSVVVAMRLTVERKTSQYADTMLIIPDQSAILRTWRLPGPGKARILLVLIRPRILLPCECEP